jgi:hypothetical protein
VKSSAMRRQTTANTPRTSRSRVTNGKALFITGKATSAYARRLADILAEIVSDLGGADQLSEAERQLARRAASLSVAAERLESIICGASPAESAFFDASNGLNAYQILNEASRVLHGLARARGGDNIREMAKLPDAEIDRIADLMRAAADIASKSIAAGNEQTSNLQLLGELSDRLGRAFLRIGLRRRPREVESLQSYLERRAHEAPEEAEAVEAATSAETSNGNPEATGDETRTGGLASPPHAYPGDDGVGV